MTSLRPALPRVTMIRRIHFALFMGVLLLAIVVLVVRSRSTAPLPSYSPSIGIAFAGAGTLAIAVAFAILRGRIPVRATDESPSVFWSGPCAASALVLWAVIEGGALIGLVGYYVTAMWSPLALVLIALFAGFIVRPAALENS